MIETLQQFLVDYPVIAPLVYVVVRTLPIIIAPLPGVVIDLVGIAVFGWVYGFFLGITGVFIGTAVAFGVSRYFREPVVKRFAKLEAVHAWEEQYSNRQKFWGLVVLRAATSPMFDYVSYAAGLTKISFVMYMLSTVIGVLPFMFSIYYFGGFSVERGVPTVIGFLVIVSLIMYVWGLLLRRSRFSPHTTEVEEL